MRISLIVAAGGKGTRFCTPGQLAKTNDATRFSKLFFPFHDKTVLETTVDQFYAIQAIREIILAVPPASKKWVAAAVKRNGWDRVKIVSGGKTRAESVLNGLRAGNARHEWIMVHDGARPLIQSEAVQKLIDSAPSVEGAILAKRVVPTLKKASATGIIMETIDRNQMYEAETPQLLKRSVLLGAYESNQNSLQATDEASLLESVGAKVKVVENPYWNPKITTFQDLEMAVKLTAAVETRTGLGQDLHRLIKGRKFVLGGVTIPSDKGPLGHSDGDVLLHAASDAILGVIAKGDIGEWFSDKNKKWKGMDSRKILSFCSGEALKMGWKIKHLDCIIHLEKPKLGPYKLKIKETLAKLLKKDMDCISVKAKTAEGFGEIGRGEAVRADVVVTMERYLS